MANKQFNSVDGYAVGNATIVIYANSSMVGNVITASSNVTAPQLISNIATGTAPFVVNSTTQVANLNVATAGTAGSATTAGTVTTAAQPNITSVGTLTSLTANGNVSFNMAAANSVAVAATAAQTSDMVTIVGNTSTAGVNALYVGFTGLAAAVEASAMRIDLTPGGTSGGTWNGLRLTQGATTASGVTVNVIKADNITAGAGSDHILYVGTGYDSIINYNGTTVINGSGQVIGSQVTGTVPSATTAGTVTTAAQPNITSVGTLTSLSVTGNVTAGNIVAPVANGNSRLTIPAAAGNVNISVNGTANVAVVTATGVNVAGTLNATSSVNTAGFIIAIGNIRGGNLVSNGVVSAAGNITGGNLISTNYALVSVATGISAAGTVVGNATALTKAVNVVSTVATGTGVSLPTAIAGMRLTILNVAGNALNVYPLGNGIINSQAANAAYSQPAGARLDYICTAAATAPGGQWYTLNATYG